MSSVQVSWEIVIKVGIFWGDKRRESQKKLIKWLPIHFSDSKSRGNNFQGLSSLSAGSYTSWNIQNPLNLINFSTHSGLQRSQDVLLTHGDSIERVCEKFKICATSSSDIVAGIYNEQARIYGVQFHPEVDLTTQGKKMFANFLFEIARLTPGYTMAGRKEECIRYIREKVGSNKVLVGWNLTLRFLSIHDFIFLTYFRYPEQIQSCFFLHFLEFCFVFMIFHCPDFHFSIFPLAEVISFRFFSQLLNFLEFF